MSRAKKKSKEDVLADLFGDDDESNGGGRKSPAAGPSKTKPPKAVELARSTSLGGVTSVKDDLAAKRKRVMESMKKEMVTKVFKSK